MKKFSIISFLMVFIGLCTCVSCGYFFSNILISSGLFSNTSLVSTEKQTVYAISMSKNESMEEVSKAKAELQSKNGAGFVYESENYFHLIASIYENKADAELVKNNLSSQSISCEVLTIELPSKNLEGNFANSEKTVLLDCLKAKFQTFKKLYDVAISIDTKVVDATNAKLQCNNIYSSFMETKTNYETVFKNKNLESVSSSLELIETQLSNLINEKYECENQSFSSLIKLTYCKILIA